MGANHIHAVGVEGACRAFSRFWGELEHVLEATEEDHAKWLGEAEDGDLKALLKPYSPGRARICNPMIRSHMVLPRSDELRARAVVRYIANVLSRVTAFLVCV